MLNNFLDLLALHRQLDELFFEHQRALMRLDLKAASQALAQYQSGLLAHMTDEEELMLPIYRERVPPPVGGATEIFLGEHEKLRQYLSLFQQEMVRLPLDDDLERRVLFLIDSQHIFKRLLVHHDTREKKILYPLLNECTGPSEKETLLSALKLPLSTDKRT